MVLRVNRPETARAQVHPRVGNDLLRGRPAHRDELLLVEGSVPHGAIALSIRQLRSASSVTSPTKVKPCPR